MDHHVRERALRAAAHDSNELNRPVRRLVGMSRSRDSSLRLAETEKQLRRPTGTEPERRLRPASHRRSQWQCQPKWPGRTPADSVSAGLSAGAGGRRGPPCPAGRARCRAGQGPGPEHMHGVHHWQFRLELVCSMSLRPESVRLGVTVPP